MFAIKFVLSVVCAIGFVKSMSLSASKEFKPVTYVLTNEQVTFDQGKRMCATHGDMVPVSIETRELNLDIISFLSSYNVTSVWTSGNDLEDRGLFRWTGTDKPFVYTKWLNGAPLHDETCRCVSVVSGLHDSCGRNGSCSGWTVEHCSSPRQVLCEVRR